MLKDPELSPKVVGEGRTSPFNMISVMQKKGQLIRQYSEKWVVDTNNGDEVKRKVEELAFLATLLYGVAGHQEGKGYNANFFS